jgi:hypothetical protein
MHFPMIGSEKPLWFGATPAMARSNLASEQLSHRQAKPLIGGHTSERFRQRHTGCGGESPAPPASTTEILHQIIPNLDGIIRGAARMHAGDAGLFDNILRQGGIGKSQVRHAIQIGNTPLAGDFVGVSFCIVHALT